MLTLMALFVVFTLIRAFADTKNSNELVMLNKAAVPTVTIVPVK